MTLTPVNPTTFITSVVNKTLTRSLHPHIQQWTEPLTTVNSGPTPVVGIFQKQTSECFLNTGRVCLETISMLHVHAHLFTRLTWSKQIEILGQVSSWKTLDPFLIKRNPQKFEHQFFFLKIFFLFHPPKLTWDRPSLILGFPCDMFVFGGVNWKNPPQKSEDALEFSPIYQCFMEEKLFDHFTAQCTDECGSGAVVARGQCALGTVGGCWVRLGISKGPYLEE